MKTMDLSVRIGSLRLANPVTVASGTFGYASEFADLIDVRKLGAIITKTITQEARPGNKPPRLAETPAGMLNAIGLQNEGLEHFIREKLPGLKELHTPVIVSISGNSSEEFVFLAQRLTAAGVKALELNLSCPNVLHCKSHTRVATPGLRDMMVSQDPKATEQVVAKVRRSTKAALIAKLSPNVTDIAEIAAAAERGGADGISLVNTFLAMAIDVEAQRPVLANVTGGLSGPAIRPIAVRMVYDVARTVTIPIIGMGGIMDSRDALEFMLAGATAVCVGTANFVAPAAALDILSGIRDYLKKHKLTRVKDIRGAMKA